MIATYILAYNNFIDTFIVVQWRLPTLFMSKFYGNNCQRAGRIVSVSK